MSETLTVNPLSEVMGAEILGVDLTSGPQPNTMALIKDAFLKHRLLIIRDQKVEKQHLRDFASAFGPIETHAVALKGVEGEALAGVHYITNLDSNGVPVEKPIVNSNYFWHSDKSFLPVPSLTTMLYAVEIPPSGGDTQFADMTRAYAALSDDDKALIEGRTVVQSLAHMREVTGNAPPTAEEMENAPPVEHPLVRTHPETGEKSLYLGMYAAEIQGLANDDSKALLERLSAHATEERFIFTQKWQPHDLVLWDNRCLMHRAVANYEMGQHRRILMRVVVKGTRPV
jgi:alpha-ketoglutarate-dependent taurine dioxygenase